MLVDIPLWFLYVMLICTLGMALLIPGLLWATRVKPKEEELKQVQDRAMQELFYRESAYSQVMQYENDLRKWK